MELTPGQKKAAVAFLQFLLNPKAKEFVLEGYSGCGKTTLTKYFIELAQSKADLLKFLTNTSGDINFMLTALTHKAASQLTKATGQEATTIHSALKLRVFNDYNTGKTKLFRAKDFQVQSNVLLFIDEASMADDDLKKLVRESTTKCKIVWIGDPKQVLPVFSKNAPVFENPENGAKLTEVARQVAGHPVIQLATELRLALDGGPMPVMEQSRGDQIQHITGDEFQELVNSHMGTINYSNDDYTILAWTNTKVQAYNQYVRSLHTAEKRYQPGESLIVNSHVMVGDTMLLPAESVVTISAVEDGGQHGIEGQWIEFGDTTTVFLADDYNQVTRLINAHKRNKDWYEYFSCKEAFADLRPAHSRTVHKSQGSTFHTVFIDLDDIGRNNKRDEVIRLLYVAVTRASHQVYLYGSLPSRMYE